MYSSASIVDYSVHKNLYLQITHAHRKVVVVGGGGQKNNYLYLRVHVTKYCQPIFGLINTRLRDFQLLKGHYTFHFNFEVCASMF